MNELGIDERNELNILMTADDLFGGHAILNQTVVRWDIKSQIILFYQARERGLTLNCGFSLINAAFLTKYQAYQAELEQGTIM